MFVHPSVCYSESLEQRRESQSLKFAKKSLQHPVHKHWFKMNNTTTNTRSKKPTFIPVKSNKELLQKNPIAYMTQLLNNNEM